jgi:hypothetical protein
LVQFFLQVAVGATILIVPDELLTHAWTTPSGNDQSKVLLANTGADTPTTNAPATATNLRLPKNFNISYPL